VHVNLLWAGVTSLFCRRGVGSGLFLRFLRFLRFRVESADHRCDGACFRGHEHTCFCGARHLVLAGGICRAIIPAFS
jgi:hypothetical protein